MEYSLEKFTAAIEKLKQEKIAKKSDVALAMGYANGNGLTQILNGATKLTAERIAKFCKVYGGDPSDFLETEGLQDTPDGTVSEAAPIYSIDTIKNRVDNIELQFETLLKGQTVMRNLLASGIEFSDVQTEHLRRLKSLVGA